MSKKYVSASDSLRSGQLDRMVAKIKDRGTEQDGGGMDKIWKTKYIKRLIERGVDKVLTFDTYEGGCPHDEDYDPSDAADEELSYWTDG